MSYFVPRTSVADRRERGRVGIAVLIGLVATVGLVWWLAVPARPDGHDEGATVRAALPPDQETAPQVELPTVVADSAHPLDVVVPAPPAPVEATPVETPDVPHVARDGKSRMYLSPEYLAEKYADATTEELELAHAALQKELNVRVREASAAFLDAGRGEVETRARAASIEEAEKTTLENNGLIYTSRTNTTASGEVLHESAYLPWDEHTALYDSQDEKLWLRAELKRRGNPVAGTETTEKTVIGQK